MGLLNKAEEADIEKQVENVKKELENHVASMRDANPEDIIKLSVIMEKYHKLGMRDIIETAIREGYISQIGYTEN